MADTTKFFIDGAWVAPKGTGTIDVVNATSGRGVLSHLFKEYGPYAGEVLTRQGNVAHWLYIIASGEVSVRVSVDGHDREVSRLTGPAFVGEMGLILIHSLHAAFVNNAFGVHHSDVLIRNSKRLVELGACDGGGP